MALLQTGIRYSVVLGTMLFICADGVSWTQESNPPTGANSTPSTQSPKDAALPAANPNSAVVGNEKIVYWQVGVTVEPKTWPVRGGIVRIPIPNEWPEQRVMLYSVEPESGLTHEQKTIDGGLNIIEVNIPRIPKGEKVQLAITYQIALSKIPVPDQSRYFKRPDKPERALSPYLGTSPLIDPKHASIKKLVSELTTEKAEDWILVERIYDWVLANIALTADQPVGAVKALANKKGNREDRINLFVAMCRCMKIPARIVWANGSEYAEFYLLDVQGIGHWVPCHLSGREFGSLTHLAVIEQKGESYKVPGSNETRRFVNAMATVHTERNARGESERPSITFVRKPVSPPQTQNKSP